MFERWRERFHRKPPQREDVFTVPKEPTLYDSLAAKAVERILSLPQADYENVQMELQYALTYWREGQKVVMESGIVGRMDKRTELLAYKGAEFAKTIQYSPLYAAVRTRMRMEDESTIGFPAGWTGWFLHPTEAQQIINAIKGQVLHELPVGRGRGGEGIIPALREIHEEHHIEGVFINTPTKIGLVKAFHAHWPG